MLCLKSKQARIRVAFFKMQENEQSIGSAGSGKPEMQALTGQVSMSAKDNPLDTLETSQPPNIQDLLRRIKQQPPKGPVIHNGERGFGSNW